MAAGRVRPIFWWLLGGALLAYVVTVTRKPRAVAPGFVALPGDTDRFSATDLRNALPEDGKRYFEIIQRVSQETGVSPVLLAAIMDVESAYGTLLSPPGPAGKGDGGHGHGLMQIDDRTHGVFLAERMPNGTPKWADPYENVKYAAGIYKAARDYFLKNPGAGAKVTVERGAASNKKGVPVGTYLDPRPMTREEAALAAIAGYNAGPPTVLRALAAGLPADTVTTSSSRSGTPMPYLANVVAAVNKLTS